MSEPKLASEASLLSQKELNKLHNKRIDYASRVFIYGCTECDIEDNKIVLERVLINPKGRKKRRRGEEG